MSRKLCLERLETRDTPSAGLTGGDLLLVPTLPPAAAPVVVTPINGTTVAIGISIAPSSLPGASSFPPAPPVLPTPTVFPMMYPDYAWMITPTA